MSVVVYDPELKIKFVDKYTVRGVKSVLMAGPIAYGDPNSYDGFREKDLVQIYTDPGGLRTLAAANVFFKEAQARQFMATLP